MLALIQKLGMMLIQETMCGLDLEELGMQHCVTTTKSILIQIKNPHNSEGFFMK
jgi:hypothetical protein